MPHISGARVLIMATNRFEESELFGPREGEQLIAGFRLALIASAIAAVAASAAAVLLVKKVTMKPN